MNDTKPTLIPVMQCAALRERVLDTATRFGADYAPIGETVLNDDEELATAKILVRFNTHGMPEILVHGDHCLELWMPIKAILLSISHAVESGAIPKATLDGAALQFASAYSHHVATVDDNSSNY